MISVVMATYNGERYLQEQLESICNQTYQPDEIIISDDHSSDSTSEIIRSFQKKTKIAIYFYCNSKRLGYAKNFRNGLRLAKGDLIFLSDQDDVWEKNKIEVCKNFFDRYPNILALSTAYRLIDENGKRRKEDWFYRFFSQKSKKINWKSFLRHPKYPGMAMAIRKVLWNQISSSKYWEGLPHDWQLNQEAAYYNGLYFLNIVLTRYRLHTKNTVGITFSLSAVRKSAARKKKRENMITEIEHSLQATALTHRMQIPYLKKAIAFQKKRKEFYSRNRIFSLFFYNLFHLNYISFRSILGDFYTGMMFFLVGESYE